MFSNAVFIPVHSLCFSDSIFPQTIIELTDSFLIFITSVCNALCYILNYFVSLASQEFDLFHDFHFSVHFHGVLNSATVCFEAT